MVHLCLGFPVSLSSVFVCLFVFWSSTLVSVSSLLVLASDSLDHTCSNRCMSLWTMSGSCSSLFVVWDFLGICWVFLGGVWGFMSNHPGGKWILFWLDILTDWLSGVYYMHISVIEKHYQHCTHSSNFVTINLVINTMYFTIYYCIILVKLINSYNSIYGASSEKLLIFLNTIKLTMCINKNKMIQNRETMLKLSPEKKSIKYRPSHQPVLISLSYI